MSVSDLVDLVGPGVQGGAVLEPADVGPGGGVDNADHLRLSTLARVDESLLLLDLRTV